VAVGYFEAVPKQGSHLENCASIVSRPRSGIIYCGVTDGKDRIRLINDWKEFDVSGLQHAIDRLFYDA